MLLNLRISGNNGKVVQAAILAMEIVLLPTGLISTFLMLKEATNPLCFFHSFFSNFTQHFVRFRLSSPMFVCFFINSIVILILISSSKFHHRKIETYDLFSYDNDNPAAVNSPPAVAPEGSVPVEEPILLEYSEDDSGEIEEEEDTIEATWEAISGGGEEKQSSKLKKSDTWPRPPPPENSLEATAAAAASWKELRKSVTFNDAVSACRRGGLARDVLRSADEMNKRFDDFIQKVNQELRLQRQESDQRFFEAIIRGH